MPGHSAGDTIPLAAGLHVPSHSRVPHGRTGLPPRPWDPTPGAASTAHAVGPVTHQGSSFWQAQPSRAERLSHRDERNSTPDLQEHGHRDTD